MHACMVGVGGEVEGGGVSATNIRHPFFFFFYYSQGILLQQRGVNEICRALDGAPVCIYSDLVGLQNWQPAF